MELILKYMSLVSLMMLTVYFSMAPISKDLIEIKAQQIEIAKAKQSAPLIAQSENFLEINK